MITLTLNKQEAYLAYRILLKGIKGFAPETRPGEEGAAESLMVKINSLGAFAATKQELIEFLNSR